jgi:hypothetical protein
MQSNGKLSKVVEGTAPNIVRLSNSKLRGAVDIKAQLLASNLQVAEKIDRGILGKERHFQPV